MAKRQNYEIRDELARHAICIWQDACAFHYTHDQLLEILAKRIWDLLSEVQTVTAIHAGIRQGICAVVRSERDGSHGVRVWTLG
jgi:hypothetical protein